MISDLMSDIYDMYNKFLIHILGYYSNQGQNTNHHEEQDMEQDSYQDPVIIKTLRRQCAMNRGGGTHRIYPQRIKEVKKYNSRYNVTVYCSQKDYDTMRKNLAKNKYSQSGVNTIDFQDQDIHELWEYANRIFNLNLNPQKYKFNDMSYQEFADVSTCKVIVDTNRSLLCLKSVNRKQKNITRSYEDGFPGYVYTQGSHRRCSSNKSSRSINDSNNITTFDRR